MGGLLDIVRGERWHRYEDGPLNEDARDPSLHFVSLCHGTGVSVFFLPCLSGQELV